MAKVRLYQDIDGCLNASHNARVWRTPEDDVDAGYRRGWVAAQYDEYGRRSGSQKFLKYKMEYNSRLIKELNALDVELVWTTTWREDAYAVGTLMGLAHESQRVLHPLDGLTTFPSIPWKFDAILHEQKHDPSPFIAVDDEWLDSAPEGMYESLTALGGLVIVPDSNIGITPNDILKMEEYISTHLG